MHPVVRGLLLFSLLAVLLSLRLGVAYSTGDSMLPTYGPRQIHVVWKGKGDVKPGDTVIAVNPQGSVVCKRVKQMDATNVWIYGDNPDVSYDSRHHGPIQRDALMGRIIYTKELRP